MGCSGCLTSRREKEASFSSVREAAKKEASEKGYAVAIVWEDDQWKLYNAFYAVQNGLTPLIEEVVSND
jgi:hypothetical protein